MNQKMERFTKKIEYISPQDAMISTVGLYVAFEKLLLDEDNKMKMEILLLFFFLFFFAKLQTKRGVCKSSSIRRLIYIK